MLRITKSADTYYEHHRLTFGILVRNTLEEAWELLEQIRFAVHDLPIIVFCSSRQGGESDARLHEFRQTTLIRTEEPVPPGSAANEILFRSLSPYTTVLWSDMSPLTDALYRTPEGRQDLCLAFQIEEQDRTLLPSIVVPALEDRHVIFSFQSEGERTLFPYDFTGCYDTAQFRSVGGYWEAFTNPFWQLADFGCRAYLWGYSIGACDHRRVAYRGGACEFDQSKDIDYIRWYRRNCTIRRGGKVLKQRRAKLHQRAIEEQKWIQEQEHRFMRSIEEVISSWDQL